MSFIERKNLERKKRLQELERKKKEEAELIEKANEKLDTAKNLVSKKKFDEAKDFYRQGAMIFQKIGWIEQAKMLFSEANNMDEMAQKYQQKIKEVEEKRLKTQEIYDNREKELRAKLEEKKRREEELRNQLPPEIRKKIKESEYLLKKAEERVQKGKYQNALKRFNYILTIYDEIGFDDEKKKIILEKISEIKEKI